MYIGRKSFLFILKLMLLSLILVLIILIHKNIQGWPNQHNFCVRKHNYFARRLLL